MGKFPFDITPRNLSLLGNPHKIPPIVNKEEKKL